MKLAPMVEGRLTYEGEPGPDFNVVVIAQQGRIEHHPGGDLMEAEWRAWHRVVYELGKRGIEINDEPVLHATLKVWSSLLALLRHHQPAGEAFSIDEVIQYDRRL